MFFIRALRVLVVNKKLLIACLRLSLETISNTALHTKPMTMPTENYSHLASR